MNKMIIASVIAMLTFSVNASVSEDLETMTVEQVIANAGQDADIVQLVKDIIAADSEKAAAAVSAAIAAIQGETNYQSLYNQIIDAASATPALTRDEAQIAAQLGSLSALDTTSGDQTNSGTEIVNIADVTAAGTNPLNVTPTAPNLGGGGTGGGGGTASPN